MQPPVPPYGSPERDPGVPAPTPPTLIVDEPLRDTLWHLAKRDGWMGGHDMTWVRQRYGQLLDQHGLAEEER